MDLKPVQGLALRVARLDATGATPTGAQNSFVTESFIRLSASPEIQTGTSITTTAANGKNCLDRKDPPTYRWWNVELEICGAPPELLELIAGALLVTDGGDNVGWGVPKLGEVFAEDGVSVELWSYAIGDDNTADAVTPYYRYALPRTYGWTLGEVAIENGARNQKFTGTAIENSEWGDGPVNDWTGPTGADARAIMAVLDPGPLPTPSDTYVAV